MLTKVIVKDGEQLTVVVHKVKYRISGEEEYRYMDVVTNLPGKVTDEDIDLHTNTQQLLLVQADVKEAIRVMNDDFVEVENKITPFTIYFIETIHHEEV